MSAGRLMPEASSRPRFARVILLGLVCSLGMIAAPVRAGSVLFDGVNVEVEGSYGEGENQTMLVIDWKSGETPSHAWLYSWSGTTTIHAMLTNLATLLSTFDYGAPGGFVTQLDYFDGEEQHLGNRAGWMSIWDSAGTGDGPTFKLTPRGVAGMNLIDGGWVGVNPDVPRGWPGAAPVVPEAAAVPEPSTVILLGVGCLVGVAAAGRRRRAA